MKLTDLIPHLEAAIASAHERRVKTHQAWVEAQQALRDAEDRLNAAAALDNDLGRALDQLRKLADDPQP